ncbi:MAG TPA: NYN domain-containing protein [Burkholderiaceae bacterium]|nr:NYN domain-containing protein [Burkholderiaceae bacterium]
MRSALFVDFDNVYSQLRQLQPEAAERFARHPTEWIGWLTDALALPDPPLTGRRRRLLVRRCYLNPNWYQTYRHAFLRAGFEIVDCPPVTSQGKTSTDMHMVLDIVDLLQHETRYDEFIVFSADADFTPVLRRLRRYDRRTTVLAIGFPSAAYQASADLLIDERRFIQDALGLRRDDSGERTDGPSPDEDTDAGANSHDPSQGNANGAVGAAEERRSTGVANPPADPDPQPAGAARPASTDVSVSLIANRIRSIVDQSAVPVSAGNLAAKLKQDYPDILENWHGSGTFRAFFRSLKLSRLEWLSGSGGRIVDPLRHEMADSSPADESDSPWSGAHAMFSVVRDVCVLTQAPLLSPREMQQVLTLLAADLQKNSFELSATTARVCDQCFAAEGMRLRLRDIAFLLRGMQLNGHVFNQGRDDFATLASRLVNQVVFLCEREQRVLDTASVAMIRRWIGGERFA